MKEEEPLSARNPKVQRLRRLTRHRAEREAENAVVLEGPTLIDEALAAGHPIEAIFTEPEHAPIYRGRGASVFIVDHDTLARSTDTVTPQGVVAIARRPTTSLDDVLAASSFFVLAGVADPGNAGTLIRTAETAGIGAVVFCDGAVDPFSPKCVRASAGSVLHVPVLSGGKGGHVLEQLGVAGVRRLGTSAGAGEAYDAADLTGRVAFVLGSEAHGLGSELASELDGWVHIPMAGRAESLNVGVAGSVLAFERARQLRRGTGS